MENWCFQQIFLLHFNFSKYKPLEKALRVKSKLKWLQFVRFFTDCSYPRDPLKRSAGSRIKTDYLVSTTEINWRYFRFGRKQQTTRDANYLFGFLLCISWELRESWKLILKSVKKWLELCKLLLINSTINIQTGWTRIFLFGYQNHTWQAAWWHNPKEALVVIPCARSTSLLLVEISSRVLVRGVWYNRKRELKASKK